MNDDLNIIVSRLKLLFKRLPHTRYWIVINNDPYDDTYNVFFNRQKTHERLYSVPLHKITNYQLDYLEELLTLLREQTKLTIAYTGFTGQIWPRSQKIIQRKRDPLE